MSKITKRKSITLNKKETAELLRRLGKEDRIRAIENSTSNQVLRDIITEDCLIETLSVSRDTLRRYRRKGLPYIKLGGNIYFSQKSVYIWLLKQEKGG